jgi:uncharacterized protein (DUF58 family)
VTDRGRIVLALGGATYLAAWAFGSKPLYPVATGLLLAVVLAWGWVRLANRPMRLRRVLGEGDHVEGDDVHVWLEVELESRVPPPSLVLVERIGKLGERRTPLHPDGTRYWAGYTLRALPRGRYTLDAAEVVIEDPFGLQQVTVPVGEAGVLVVYPRLVDLDRLFSETGARAHEGRRMLIRRPSGFDFHGVREYQEGESLRRVHWRSTARRGRLMVKEVEDAPRDETAVVLDADAAAVAGSPPESSFDVQVRAAGSVLRAHARRGRRAVLVVASMLRESQRISSSDGDWRRALDLLAGLEPSAGGSVTPLLAEDASAAGRSLELTVVTSQVEPRLVERLVHLALSRRRVSLVYVDPASFGARRRPQPGLLRLQAAGIPVTIVRRGDDLAVRLGGAPLREAASGSG